MVRDAPTVCRTTPIGGATNFALMPATQHLGPRCQVHGRSDHTYGHFAWARNQTRHNHNNFQHALGILTEMEAQLLTNSMVHSTLLELYLMNPSAYRRYSDSARSGYE